MNTASWPPREVHHATVAVAIVATTVASAGIAVAPIPTLALLGAAAFLGLSWRAPALALALWTIGFLTPYSTAGGALQRVGVVVLFPAVARAAWLHRHALAERIALLRVPAALLAALLAWLTATAFWSVDPAATLSELWKWYLCATIVAYQAVLLWTRRDLLIAVGGWAVGAGLAALSAVNQLDSAGDSDAVLVSTAGRLSGAAGDPNILAAGVVAGAVLTVGLVAAAARTPWRFLLVPVAMLQLFVALGTGSRGGLASLVVAVVAIAVVFRRHVTMVLLSCVGLAVALATYLVAYPRTLERLTAFSGGGSGRNELWKVATAVYADHPLVGVGLGAFKSIERSYLMDVGYLQNARGVVEQLAVHNAYLEMLAESGTVGFLLWIAFVGTCVTMAWRADWLGDRHQTLGRIIAVAAGTMLVSAAFISMAREYRLWFLLGLGPIAFAIMSSRPSHTPPPRA